MADLMLTTTDNPFNPFTQWDSWFSWDAAAGYNTPAFLARVIQTSPNISEADQDLDIEDAIDEIVRENILGVYARINSAGEINPN